MALEMTDIMKDDEYRAEMESRLNGLKRQKDILCGDGYCKQDPYAHGLVNGLILAIAMMENKNPDFVVCKAYVPGRLLAKMG